MPAGNNRLPRVGDGPTGCQACLRKKVSPSAARTDGQELRNPRPLDHLVGRQPGPGKGKWPSPKRTGAWCSASLHRCTHTSSHALHHIARNDCNDCKTAMTATTAGLDPRFVHDGSEAPAEPVVAGSAPSSVPIRDQGPTTQRRQSGYALGRGFAQERSLVQVSCWWELAGASVRCPGQKISMSLQVFASCANFIRRCVSVSLVDTCVRDAARAGP